MEFKKFKPETDLTESDKSNTKHSHITVHTTDEEDVIGDFDVVGASLNPETVILEMKNSKGNIEKIIIKKANVTEEGYKEFQMLQNQSS